MSSTAAPRWWETAFADLPTPGSMRLWLGAVVFTAGSWAIGLLLPYYANGLHREPLEAVAGGLHDPSFVWPYISGGPIAVIVSLATLVAIAISLPYLGLSALAAPAFLFVRRRDLPPTAARPLQAIALLSIGTMALALSPLGQALLSWQFD